MNKKLKFSCPVCNRPQRFKKLFFINVGEITHCDHCENELIPTNNLVPYKYLYGFIFGSVTSYVLLYLSNLPELLKFALLPLILLLWLLYGYFSISFNKVE